MIINRKKIIERKSFYEIAVFRRSGGGRFDPLCFTISRRFEKAITPTRLNGCIFGSYIYVLPRLYHGRSCFCLWHNRIRD